MLDILARAAVGVAIVVSVVVFFLELPTGLRALAWLFMFMGILNLCTWKKSE